MYVLQNVEPLLEKNLPVTGLKIDNNNIELIIIMKNIVNYYNLIISLLSKSPLQSVLSDKFQIHLSL